MKNLRLAILFALISWEAHCLIWWFMTNGFSLTGMTINHFGEYGNGNIAEWILLSLFLVMWNPHEVFLHFMIWYALLVLYAWAQNKYLQLSQKSKEIFKKSVLVLFVIISCVSLSIFNIYVKELKKMPAVAPVSSYYGANYQIVAPNTPWEMGVIRFCDLRTNNKCFEKRIYRAIINPFMNVGAQVNFITTMKRGEGKLIVTDQKDRIYEIILSELPFRAGLKRVILIDYNANPLETFRIADGTPIYSLNELKKALVEHMKNNFECYYDIAHPVPEDKKIAIQKIIESANNEYFDMLLPNFRKEYLKK